MNLLNFAGKNNSASQKNLPSLFFFTDRKRFQDIFSVIKNLPQGAAVIVREYDLNYSDRLIFAQKVKLLTQKKSLKLIIGKDLSLAIKIKADGVHFSDHDLSWMNYLHYKKTSPRNFIFTCSAHQFSSLIKADKLALSAVFYSPIFPTKSHPDAKIIGVLQLAKTALKIKTPLIALGGINPGNIRLLKGCKISGIAGIDLVYLNSETK